MTKKNTKRNYRTPEQIIADTEAKLEKLRLRAAKRAAADNPLVAPLVAQKNDLVKQLREAKKLLGTGPQSASARIETHEKWITKILDQRAEAESLDAEITPQIEAIDAQIVAAIEESVQSDEASN
jgi:capsule polysaccharide export protein KpsE/RkpR